MSTEVGKFEGKERSVAKESTEHFQTDVEELEEILPKEVKGGSVAKETTDHVRIDVGELEEIRQKGTHLNIDSSPVCIFEVPTCLKDLNTDVYVPKVVGLGPLHHHHTLPRVNQLNKKAVVRTLLRIYGDDPLPNAMEKLRKEIMKIKKEIQECYETPFPFDSDIKKEIQECYEMPFSFDPDIFILDSCFLLDFIFPNYSCDKSKASYYEIERHLVKLENQIPLILLKTLLILQGHSDQDIDDMIDTMVLQLFGHFYVKVPLKTSLKKPRHLLEGGQQFLSGFVRDAAALERNNDEKKSDNNDTSWSFPAVRCGLFNCRESEKDDMRDATPAAKKSGNDDNMLSFPAANKLEEKKEEIMEERKEEENAENDDNMSSFPTAHELEKAGIELRRGDKLSFERKWWGLKGVLTIPRIVMDDSTEVGLRNIIAFENCLPLAERLVTEFVAFLDCLIDKDTDVGVLRRTKIIDNLLKSDRAVANLVNSSCVNVTAPDNLKCLKESMKTYHSSSWRVMMQEFMDTHLSKPWLLFGTLAAVLLLALTIVQTIYTVMSYKAAE